MVTRRSLFGLIPAPLALHSGLLTTSFTIPSAPSSDPVASAALAVAEAADHLSRVPAMFAGIRAEECGRLSAAQVDHFERRQTAWALNRLRAAECELAPLLDALSGVAVVTGGRVYPAGDSGRRPALLRPVLVALLTPSNGGGE